MGSHPIYQLGFLQSRLNEIPGGLDNKEWLSEARKKASTNGLWGIDIARFFDNDLYITPNFYSFSLHGEKKETSNSKQDMVYFEKYKGGELLFRLLVYGLHNSPKMDIVRFSPPYQLHYTGVDNSEKITPYHVSGYGLFQRDVLESFEFRSPELARRLEEMTEESDIEIDKFGKNNAAIIQKYVDNLRATLTKLDDALAKQSEQR